MSDNHEKVHTYQFCNLCHNFHLQCDRVIETMVSQRDDCDDDDDPAVVQQVAAADVVPVVDILLHLAADIADDRCSFSYSAVAAAVFDRSF